MLTILCFEGRDNFVKRWKTLKKVTSRIHDQMSDQIENGQFNVIQETDVFGEELKRVAVQLSLKKRITRSVSRCMQT